MHVSDNLIDELLRVIDEGRKANLGYHIFRQDIRKVLQEIEEEAQDRFRDEFNPEWCPYYDECHNENY